MRIMALLPGEGIGSPEERDEELRTLKEYFMQFSSLGTEILVSPTKGVEAIMHGRDIALLVPGAIGASIQAEKDGFDAVIIHAI